MKNTCYFTLNFPGFTTAASETQSYLRMVDKGHVFYTDKRYFQDPSLFERLKINQPLHIGTCRLQDGSYWIHWMSDGKTLLEPAREPLKGKLLAFFIGTLASVPAAYQMYFHTTRWVVIVCATIAALALAVALMGLTGLLLHGRQQIHPGMRKLMARMDQARRGDFSFCQPVPPLVKRAMPPFSDYPPLPERFRTQEKELKNLNFKKWSSGSGKSRRVYHGVMLQCDTTPLSFAWQIYGTGWDFHPIFYRHHPPFLACGDRIIAVYQHDDSSIQALYNGSDGGAYLKGHPFYLGEQQISQLYKVIPAIALALFLFILGLVLHNMLTSGWDGWKFAITMLKIFSLTLLSVGGLLVMLELCSLATHHLSSRVKDWLALQSAFKRYIGRAGADITIQELM